MPGGFALGAKTCAGDKEIKKKHVSSTIRENFPEAIRVITHLSGEVETSWFVKKESGESGVSAQQGRSNEAAQTGVAYTPVLCEKTSP